MVSFLRGTGNISPFDTDNGDGVRLPCQRDGWGPPALTQDSTFQPPALFGPGSLCLFMSLYPGVHFLILLTTFCL